MTDNQYMNAKIYKILNSSNDDVYVGSTIQSLSQRMAKHRSSIKHKPHYRLYQHMQKFGVDTFYIELIENYPCRSKDELRAKEGEWIRRIGTLNDKVAGRSGKDWYNEHREEHSAKCKEYRQNNLEAVKEKAKQFRLNNIDKIREYDKQRYEGRKEGVKARVRKWKQDHEDYVKERSKEWREENRDRKREMDRQYREKNKDKLREQHKQWRERRKNELREQLIEIQNEEQ